MIRIDESNKAALRVRLVETIEKWISEVAESEAWPGHWTGEQTNLMMADAALAVLWATAEAQQSALHEEIYKEA